MLVVGDVVAQFRFGQRFHGFAIRAVEQELEAQWIIVVKQVAAGGATDLQHVATGSCCGGDRSGGITRQGCSGHADLHIGNVTFPLHQVLGPAQTDSEVVAAACSFVGSVVFTAQSLTGQGVTKLRDLAFVLPRHVSPIPAGSRQCSVLGAGHDFKRSRVGMILLSVIVIRRPQTDPHRFAWIRQHRAQPSTVGFLIFGLADQQAFAARTACDIGNRCLVDRGPVLCAIGE